MEVSGRLVILSGPSGVGKDTVIDAWCARNPQVQRVIAATTRPPRPGEVDGVHYHFRGDEDFKAMARVGELIEYKFVHGYYYGTPLKQTERLLQSGSIAILKIDVQGGIDVMQKRPDAVSIFLMPPSEEELERRLRRRGTEREGDVALRLRNAQDEVKIATQTYSHLVVNDKVDRVVDQLEEIVGG